MTMSAPYFDPQAEDMIQHAVGIYHEKMMSAIQLFGEKQDEHGFRLDRLADGQEILEQGMMRLEKDVTGLKKDVDVINVKLNVMNNKLTVIDKKVSVHERKLAKA